MLTASTNTDTNHDAVLARKFIKTRLQGLTLTNSTTLLVCVFEDVEVVVISVVAYEDIGNEFQD